MYRASWVKDGVGWGWERKEYASVNGTWSLVFEELEVSEY